MLRSIALLLTIPTGFTGLVYEVTWQKYLATLLGSHSEATAAVLAIFLGGLSAGYALFGSIARRHVARAQAQGRRPRLLVIYGAVEIAIGVYALCFPGVFGLVQEVSYRVPHASAAAGFAFDVGLCALLVAPPAVLMGATIPLLTQALARGLDDATRFHAWVYAFNTAGAFGGALVAGFVLVPALGLAGAMWAMCGVNVVVGGLFLLLGRGGDAAGLVPGPDRPEPVRGVGDLYAVAALVGFAMMALQTAVIRVGGLAFGASEYVFSTVVAVFVLCIAIGSSVVSLFASRLRPFHVWVVAWLLVALLALLYPALGDSPYWAHRLRVNFSSHLSDVLPYYLSGFGVLLLTLGPAVVCSGALLPMLFHCLRGQAGDLGAVAGRLYAWNTVGSLVGALLGGYLLLFWIDLDSVYRIALGTLAAAAAWLVVRVSRRSAALGAGLAACGLAGAALLPGWDPQLLSIGLFRVRTVNPLTMLGPRGVAEQARKVGELLFYTDGPTSSVAVEKRLTEDRQISLSIKNNGKSDGATALDYPTMSLVGIIPALLVDEARSSFVIGFGTGVTAGSLGQFPSMQRILVAEISKGVIDAAPLFDTENWMVSKDPRVEIVRSDAYRALMRSDEQFDVIVSEPSNPWVAGVEMLFSREFLEAARARLTPGGIFAQWYHQYDTDAASVAMVLRTYAAVFESMAVWYGLGADLGWRGVNDGRTEIDLDRIERRFADPAIQEELERAKVPTLPALLAHEIWPVGVLHALELEGRIHRLQHPILSHQAGRGFFLGGVGSLPFAGVGMPALVGESRSLLGRLGRRGGGRLDERARAEATRAACAERMSLCVTMLAQWKVDDPDSPLREEVLDEAVRVKAQLGLTLKRKDLAQVVAMLKPTLRHSRRPIEIEQAREMTRIFYRYSHATLPLPVEPLLDAWNRCKPRASCRNCCANGSRAVHARLEAFGVNDERWKDARETTEARFE
jgi:spermidine synthase